MRTNAIAPDSTSTSAAQPRSDRSSTAATQKVVIVNGSPEMLQLLDTVLDAGHYDVVFVESNEHAYSQVKRVQPNLVILCVCIDDMDGFQVLSMLKLDAGTRDIPVLTYTTEYEQDAGTDEPTESAAERIFTSKPALIMN